MSKIRIGTRGSALALAQAHETQQRLIQAHGLSETAIEIVKITTTGDRIRDRPLADIGGKGLFTKEIEEQLLAGEIDMAVHSMKDMPAVYPDGLEMVCYLPREDARDAFISPVAGSLAELPKGAIVGSSSARRGAQVKQQRPDLEVVPFRGNVGTRLRKLEEGVAQATFLACAGLNRLGMADAITAAIPVEEMLPAVAQGAIGIQIHADNTPMRELLAPLNHRETEIRIAAERGFLCGLDGSCRTPLAAHAVLRDGKVDLRGLALTLDGSALFDAVRNGAAEDAAKLGRDAADEVREKAGDRLFV